MECTFILYQAARVDAERPRRHIFVVLRFGVRKEGEGAGVAHQHPLPPLHEGQRIDADAVPEAHGLHFGNGRLVQRQRALRQFHDPSSIHDPRD